MHTYQKKRKMLDPKAKRCILLGYGTNVKGYFLYCPQERTIIYSRDVVFDETKYGLEKEQVENESEADKLVEIDLSDDECEISQTFKRKLIKLKVNQVMRLQEMNQLRPTLVYDVSIKKDVNWITMGCGSILLRPKNSITNLILLRKGVCVLRETNG